MWLKFIRNYFSEKFSTQSWTAAETLRQLSGLCGAKTFQQFCKSRKRHPFSAPEHSVPSKKMRRSRN